MRSTPLPDLPGCAYSSAMGTDCGFHCRMAVMTSSDRHAAAIEAYHAHIYYDPAVDA